MTGRTPWLPLVAIPALLNLQMLKYKLFVALMQLQDLNNYCKIGVSIVKCHSPVLTGNLPVRKADLLGVHIASAARCCDSFTPLLQMLSMMGVLMVSFPKQPTSPIPRSSARSITIFGGFVSLLYTPQHSNIAKKAYINSLQ